MKYQYLKLSQIIILSLISIYEQNPLIYLCTLAISLLSHGKHWLSSITGLVLIIMTLWTSIEVWKLVILTFMLLLGLLSAKFASAQHLSVKYLVPVFLLTISLISINSNQFIRVFQLLVFFYFLILTYYFHETKLKPSLYVTILILLVEGALFSMQHFLEIGKLEESQSLMSQNREWWYFLAFPFSIQCASFIIQSLKAISNSSSKVVEEQNGIQIEMIDMEKLRRVPEKSELQREKMEMEDYFRNIEMHTDEADRKNVLNKKAEKGENNFMKQSIKQEEERPSPPYPSLPQNQSQNLNMLLVLPFLIQDSGLLQLPLLTYIFSVHYNQTSPYFYFFMLLTNFLIIFFQIPQTETNLDNAILLRIAIVLLVNKNIHVLTEMTEIVKKIWLRSSFVLVLGFLFWFSLKTVNVFHIVLTIILLIFISAKNEKNHYSYRHKNWVYLLSFFNIFLLLREIYHLAIYYNLYGPPQSSLFQNIIQLAGISHSYQPESRFFNLIPEIVSIFLGFQYLTYQSRIYNQVRQRPILPLYEKKIHELIKFFSIIYYKLIPWLSYGFIFTVILVLEFSCTSLILLVWLLVSLGVQVQRRNQPRTYEIMHSLWSVLQRLFAIQIILRYAFEFLTFPMFYSFFHSLPFFSTIEQYKEFLGLAIRQGDYVYFKAITKFQLMVGLDFICIFISFLVIEYYTYLLAYHEIENLNSGVSSLGRIIEKDVIKEIYGQYIDFKLTLYFKKFTVWLKYASKIFLWLYYPSLGIYCCLFPSFITFCFLLVGIRFYLTKNSESYDKFIKENLIFKVKELFTNWKEEISGNQLYQYAAEIYDIMTAGKKAIRFDELVSFERLRKYLLVMASLGVVLHYASRVFELQETGEFFGVQNEALIKLRWLFYVGGVSIDSKIQMFELLIILGSTILEVKCTRFLLRLYDLSAKSQQKSKESTQNLQLIDEKEGELIQDGTLYKSLLQKDRENQAELKKQLEQLEQLKDADYDPALKRHIETLRQDNDDEESSSKMHDSTIMNKRRDQLPTVLNGRESQRLQLEVSKKQLKKFIEMKVSLLQGATKFVQRCFVMVLVFLSIIENRHPFGIVYLVCSMVLTFLGAYSILNLSKVIAFLIIAQYLLIMANYANYTIVDSGVPQFKQNFQSANTFEFIFPNIPKDWEDYLTFGDTSSQLIMMVMSWVILFCYQLYFQFLNKSWEQILDSLAKKMTLSRIQKKIYEYSNLIYTYFLIYSPLCITICSLGIYLLDFTITNLFLTVVSILFLFKSVLYEEYSGSRQFWRAYFYLLQFFIVIFMLIYSILSIPMYQHYCIKFLCSSEEFHTKVYKAGLLFVLQIGIDLTKSSYFINALDNLQIALTYEVMFSKLAIAYKENDRKINKKFKEMNEEQSLDDHLIEVQQFLQKYKTQPDVTYENKKQIVLSSESWIDVLLEILPSFVDSTLVLTSQQAREFVSKENEYWMTYHGIDNNELEMVEDQYFNEFGNINDYDELMEKIKQIRQQINVSLLPGYEPNQDFMKENSVHYDSNQPYQIPSHMMRKSFSQKILPYEAESFCKQRLQEVRQSLIVGNQSETEKKVIEKQEKKKILFLLILESTISNWHYLTYFFLVLQHLVNMGFLTLPFPLIVFWFGLIYPYQAPKTIWKACFLCTLLPIAFKFGLAIGFFDFLEDWQVHIWIGDHPESIWLEYLIIMLVLVECLILKIIGLYEDGVTRVEPMKIALIRNIINNDNQTEISHLSHLLKESLTIPEHNVEFVFSRTQQKAGSSYTTLMTSLQLMTLFFVFFFYDQMAIRKEVTIYQMISYNQFTAGMVILTLIQLTFILLERFIHISDFKEYSQNWEFNLLLKFVLLLLNFLYIEALVLWVFPINSNTFTGNFYISFFYVLNALVFLVSALQIKFGIDQKSKGFMDRYTWYNGFVYMGFRAVPFLFEFKVFSDWTFTKTALRLFDWIKMQEIFGRMYIAKCNSIFLQGKVIGSKIEWWKKLLMGFPLLFAIILLIFGPLILFSNLNPLASKNSISAGYLELCLKVNRTNQYVFYTNSHITDIVNLVPNQAEKDILSSYDIDQDTVQVINLEEYSDQYWEISQGSYLKLLEQPQDSLYQIVIRMKFQRNETGSTPTYTVNTFEVPSNQIKNFKQTLQGQGSMVLPNFLNNFLRLDNNNGIHFLGQQKLTIKFLVQQAKKNANKKYWIIENGLKIKIASDKYTKAIFGYSVMSFYISIILVIANYFRFLFQGSANTIILNDIPFADPVLSMCNGVYKARYDGDTEMQERLFWLIIDLLRSPDQIKSLTGSYLDARMETKQVQKIEEQLNKNNLSENIQDPTKFRLKQEEDEKISKNKKFSDYDKRKNKIE